MEPRKLLRDAIALVLALAAGIGRAPAQDDAYREDLEAIDRAMRRGEISKARSIAEDVLAELDDAPGAATIELAMRCRLALFEIGLGGGEYDRVIEQCDALPEAQRADARVRGVFAEAATRRGRYQEAELELRAILAAVPGALDARCRLGELLVETGRGSAGRTELEQVAAARSGRAGDPSGERVADRLAWGARAHMALGGRAHVEAAATLLAEALQIDPDHAAARTLRGRLQFEVYGEWANADSGESLLLDVLKRNGEVEDALIWLYRIRRTNHLLDPAKTEQFLDRALAANPRCVAALVEKSRNLVDDRRFDEGAEVLDRALAVNRFDKRALAQRAAVALLGGDEDEYASFRARALAVDGGYAGVDIAIGDRLVALYRFGAAIAYYDAALVTAPDEIDAMHGLAKALVYTGQGERARAVLGRAKELQAGYVNPWRNNLIAVQDLIDEQYEQVDEGGFRFVLHRDDRAVLERYLIPFQIEAREVLGKKYGYVPDELVRIEAFHTWDDFSVRTIGFRGFTALGACFGPLITLVSPVDGDLRRNDFMWTATVWHEYTHVLTLALSSHRVPRWLTEGFSVYEEGQKNRAWERGMDRELLDAYHNDDIPPVRLLNRLFRGPRILFGYYQGGLIVDRLAAEFGFDKVLEMLRAYGRDLSTEEVFRETFGIESTDFDRRFHDWVRDERLARLRIRPRLDDRAVERLLARVAREPEDVASQLQLAWAMLQRGSEVDAGNHLRAVLQVDPENPEAQLVHAELFRRRDRLEDAAAAFARGFAGGADDFDSRLRYARLLNVQSDFDGAIRELQAAKACWPQCTDQASAPELELARIYREAGRRDEAMMELTTYCARTARAYGPRLELAEFSRERGDRKREAALLTEAIAIDPFSRSVHLRLADAYDTLDRQVDLVRELEVALAVVPGLDRDFLGKPPTEVPQVDSPEFRESQAEVCVRLARALRAQGREDAARRYLERAVLESPGGAAAEQAREMLAGR